jgi:hypothetical protein
MNHPSCTIDNYIGYYRKQMKAPLTITAMMAMLFVSAEAIHAEEKSGQISIYGQATYGSYINSVERSEYISRIAALTYQKADEYSASLSVMDSDLHWKHSLGDIHTTAPAIGLTRWISLSPENLIGVRLAATYITSDDSNADEMIVPYMSIMGKSRDGSKYVDVGYAHSNYGDATINQFTGSYGFSLLDSRLWLRTRVYYLDLGNEPVEGINNSFAVEEKLIWHAVPQKLSVAFSGLAGSRVHGYDPDSNVVYTLPDIQRGSGSISIGYSISSSLHLYGDACYESYRKPSIDNDYGAIYGTVGLTYKF